MKIFFVGIHNKPGKGPLDITTKSGKVITEIIKRLPPVLETVRTNLFDTDFFPEVALRKDVSNARAWALRVGFTDQDIAVTLGDSVHRHFRNSGFTFITRGHPASQRSKEKQAQYIVDTAFEICYTIIKKKINHETLKL